MATVRVPIPMFCRILAALALAAALVPSAARPQTGTPFERWLAELRQEAISSGISTWTVDRALDGVEPIDRVIELDRRQPETRLTFEQYVERVVPPSRVESGRRMLQENMPLLRRVSARYGVQPRFIVALWGVESDFGRRTGGFPVIASLATLAYDGRRSAFFRAELLDALWILDQGHIDPDAMTGSWAGAMGQAQFMPSSFRQFAVDFDGDGRSDIWQTRADVFASAANYLAEAGWDDTYTWGRPVLLPPGFDRSLAGLETRKQLGMWQRLGVRRIDGSDLPAVAIDASLILPNEESSHHAFLVYDNYRTILEWNRSTYFALAVGLLSDAIDVAD